MTLAFAPDTEHQQLHIDAIAPNPDQPRKLFDQVKLDELAASITENGLMQAITVRRVKSVVHPYLIVAGERRWRAAKQAGLQTITARVLDTMADDSAFVLSVLENVNRADMTITEEARAFDHLVGTGRSTVEVAKLFGKTSDYVAWRVDLLALADRHLDLVDAGAVSVSLAWHASKLEPAGQATLLNRAARGEFPSERAAISFAQAALAGQQQGFMFEVEEVVAKQTAARAEPVDDNLAPSEFDQHLAAMDSIRDMLTGLVPVGAKPRDVAAQLGLDAIALRDYLDDLVATATAARRVIRRAAGMVELAQTKAEATA